MWGEAFMLIKGTFFSGKKCNIKDSSYIVYCTLAVTCKEGLPHKKIIVIKF